ncbi:restriction endonuclease subunit S [Nitrospira defluvii]|uniref:Type I restriction-modification system, specificity subunit S n=1 Tax=Nitrospira defluvii TaxID=330214 RepID=A0ABN7MB03_9BACT|nr:restriction endonuclease subunit S [Nitrospira defluvii]CAE6794275.1 Type I restriction-modification system, specificity subunit S [Nitrospira defluvii]
MADNGSRQTLGDYFTLQRGTTYKSRLLGLPGPVLLGLATIQRNGGFRTDSLQTYGGESPAKLLVRPGDLYLSLKDVTQSADLLGAVARLPIDHPPGRLTQDTVKLEPKGSDVPLDYLYWLLRTPQYRSYCRAHATGTTNLGLGREDFLSFPAPEPTTIQCKIVNTLATLDDKIELNRRMNKTLEAMARALFKSWFVDFDPVRAKAEGRDPGLPKSLADLFPESFENSELGEIPKGWKIGTLGDFSGLNPESWSRDTRPSEIEYIDLSNTKWGRVEEITKFAADDAPSRAQRVLRPRDTIVGTVRPGNGSYAFILVNGLTGSTGFAVLRPQRDMYAEFVYLAATSADNIQALAHLADGGAYPAVRPEVVAATQVTRPKEDILGVFSRAAGPMLLKIADNERESRTLAALRDRLLPKLISGELRIRKTNGFERGMQHGRN